MSDQISKIKLTLDLNSTNCDEALKLISEKVNQFGANPAVCYEGLVCFKESTVTKLKFYEREFHKMANTIRVLKEENQSLQIHNQNLIKEIINCNPKQKTKKRDEDHFELVKNNQNLNDCFKIAFQDRPELKDIKLKIKQQLELIKTFNIRRIEFSENLSTIADNCLKKLEQKRIELDPLKAQLDFEKELNNKLQLKLKSIHDCLQNLKKDDKN